jgi:hypothetical protein
MYKTFHAVFYTQNMEAKVRQYVSQCQICKKSKIPIKKYGRLPETGIQCDPWEIFQIDLFGPWTFTDIDNATHHIQGLSRINVATHWVEICPYNSKQSKDIALLVDQNWFCRYPRPRIAIFDNGTEFSYEFLELLRSFGVTAKPTTIKNPQTISVTDINNRSTETISMKTNPVFHMNALLVILYTSTNQM